MPDKPMPDVLQKTILRLLSGFTRSAKQRLNGVERCPSAQGFNHLFDLAQHCAGESRAAIASARDEIGSVWDELVSSIELLGPFVQNAIGDFNFQYMILA